MPANIVAVEVVEITPSPTSGQNESNSGRNSSSAVASLVSGATGSLGKGIGRSASIISQGTRSMSKSLVGDGEADKAAAYIQAVYRGNKDRALTGGKMILGQLLKARQLFNVNFWGNPVSTTIASSLDVGSPPDATLYERARDLWLSKMVTLSPIFMAISALGALGVLGFGLFILVLLFPVIFGIEMGGMSELLYPECNSSAYDSSLVLTETSHDKPPRIIGAGLQLMEYSEPHYVQFHCTLAQQWFNLCVKYFTIYFGYVNLLPLPWTFAIFINAMCPRASVKGKVGVDFYGRPSDSLWFHLSRDTRRHCAFWLLFALVSQVCAITFHLIWFSYIAGQTMPGVVLQNVWILAQLIGQIAASTIQAKEEKRVREANPGKFPPKLEDYLKASFVRWHKANKTRKERPKIFCGEHNFVEFVLQEMKQFKEESAKFGAVDALTGIQLTAVEGKKASKERDRLGSSPPASPQAAVDSAV